MSDMAMEDQIMLGEKIKNLVIFVGLLSDKEVSTLKKIRKHLQDENVRLTTVGGLLVDLDAADHKISRNNAMIKRLDGFLAIHESNFDLADADMEYQDKAARRQDINKMFGL